MQFTKFGINNPTNTDGQLEILISLTGDRQIEFYRGQTNRVPYRGQTNRVPFGSAHATGIIGVLMDGSVQEFSFDIEDAIFRAYGRRNDTHLPVLDL